MASERIDATDYALHIKVLDRSDPVSGFDCGQKNLNRFLQEYAVSAPKQGLSRTWVAIGRGRVLGYYTLAVATVLKEDAVGRMVKGMPDYPIPCALLARLAVDKAVQGQRLGAFLLRNAMQRIRQISDDGIPMKAVLVHAKDQETRNFYARYGFESSPTHPLHLFLLLKDIPQLSPESGDKTG